MYKTSCKHMHLFLSGRSRRVGLLGRRMLNFIRTPKRFPRIIVPFYALIGNIWEFQLHHILANLVLSVFVIVAVVVDEERNLTKTYCAFLWRLVSDAGTFSWLTEFLWCVCSSPSSFFKLNGLSYYWVVRILYIRWIHVLCKTHTHNRYGGNEKIQKR